MFEHFGCQRWCDMSRLAMRRAVVQQYIVDPVLYQLLGWTLMDISLRSADLRTFIIAHWIKGTRITRLWYLYIPQPYTETDERCKNLKHTETIILTLTLGLVMKARLEGVSPAITVKTDIRIYGTVVSMDPFRPSAASVSYPTICWLKERNRQVGAK